MAPMEPVPSRERIPEIDVLRGVALAGIIISNMRAYHVPAELYPQPILLWTEPRDRFTQAVIDCFVTGKFITLFAMLFGLGFAVQLERAKTRGEGFSRVYVRRLVTLALLGAVHTFLIWWGDILLSYALVGFLLLLFGERMAGRAIFWVMILYWTPLVLFLGFAALSQAGIVQAPGIPTPAGEVLRATTRIYTEGSYREMIRERFREWLVFNSAAPYFLPRIFGIFLFGLYVWRRRLFQELPAHRPALRRAWKWLLAVGGVGNVVYVLIQYVSQPNPMEPSPETLTMWVFASAGMPALSLFYAIAVILLYGRPGGRRLLAPFAAVGRMALTNYVLQSLICTTIFYGYGLGLYGRMTAPAGLALAILIYALQVVLSYAWLRAFRYGPLEWFWRSLTYAKWQPLRARG